MMASKAQSEREEMAPFRSGLAVGLALCLGAGRFFLAGCRKKQLPSEDFARANQLFVRVYAAKLDEAYLDPRMIQVEEWLRDVPADSLDFQAAQSLSDRIKKGRVSYEEGRAARRAAIGKPTPFTDPRFSPTRKRVAVDAGFPGQPPGRGQPAVGMALGEFTNKFSGCFKTWTLLTLVKNGVRQGEADTWEMKDIANCRDRYPLYVKRIFLTDGRIITARADKDSVETVTRHAGTPTQAQNTQAG